jgi:hypothetical protein
MEEAYEGIGDAATQARRGRGRGAMCVAITFAITTTFTTDE